MKVFQLFSALVFYVASPLCSQTVMFGPKTMLLENLEVQYVVDASVVGDFDGDGDIDLAGLYAGNLVLFQNRGDFSFDTIDLPEDFIDNVMDVADMNADGIDDVVTTDAYYALDSAQVFTRHEFNFGDFRFVRVARDLNLDGYADVIAEFDDFSGEPIMYEYRNNAGTGFTQRLLENQESSYDYVTVVDYNQDEKMDVIIVNADNNRFLIYRQGTSGGFSRVVIPVSTDVLDLGVGLIDVDNDNDLDIISGAPLDFEESLYYLENKSLSFTTRHPIHGFLDIYSLETGDLDGDGDGDLVFINRQSSYRVGYIINEGMGSWSDPVYLGTFSSFGSFAYQNINVFDNWLHLKDMDLDGKKDIVVSAIPDDEVFWFKNETLFTSTATLVSSPVIFYPQPASDFIRVENLPFKDGVLTLFDSYGRQLMQTEIQNQDVISLERLPTGLHHYLVSSNDHYQLLAGKLLKIIP